jgi:hypothetical protein
MFKRLGNIIGWTLLGMVGGFAALAMYFTFLSMLPVIMATDMPPPIAMEWMSYGGILGLAVGIWQAGFRVYLKD